MTVSLSLTASERQTYRRYAELALPRHTSYPIAPVWKTEYGAADFGADLARSGALGRPLSLYFHIPFCEQLCYYCACTKEIVPKSKGTSADITARLLEGLAIEIDRYAELVGPGAVRQVHFGGGSPTYLAPAQLQRLWQRIADRFAIAADAEIAVEVDPRLTTREHLQTLRTLGFNRISLGIQDFAPKVQEAVNRIQPFGLVEEFVGWCREVGFGSINFDLIYGLPFQTIENMTDTIEKTIALGPDRIAFYRLAVIPEIFRWQNVFKRTDMPSGELPLELNLLAIGRFTAAGYAFIGLDHFARPTEALARAAERGGLRRTFQGMTTGSGLDVVGLGPSAISQLEDAYAQNKKSSGEWGLAAADNFATERGMHLSFDDRLRRELLQQLYGRSAVDKRSLEAGFGVTFDEYFADELARLETLAEEGLVTLSTDAIGTTTLLGRLLVRVVAAVFDRYLPPTAFREGLASHLASKVG